MNYVRVSFSATEQETRDILTALLSEAGFEAFEEGAAYLYAYIPEPSFDTGMLEAAVSPAGLDYTFEVIAQQNWNAQWESGFEPVLVGEFCVVRAPFHEPVPTVRHEVIIMPKMSFGTGHHATTQLMLQTMEYMDFRETAVFDFGSGTGILAILAAQLGAAHVVAVDNDEWSADNARENVSMNGVEGIDVHLGTIDLIRGQQFDVILANINRHILVEYMVDMYAALKPGGTLLMSGLLKEDEPLIIQTARNAGFNFDHTSSLNNWIAVKVSK